MQKTQGSIPNAGNKEGAGRKRGKERKWEASRKKGGRGGRKEGRKITIKLNYPKLAKLSL